MSCLICNTNLCDDEVVELRTIGIENLIKISHARKDDIAEALRGLTSITLHYKCKRLYHRFEHTENGERIYRPFRQNCKKTQPREVPADFEYVPITSDSTENIEQTFEAQFIPEFSDEADIPIKEEIRDYPVIKNKYATEQACNAEFIEHDSNKPFLFYDNCFFCGLKNQSEIYKNRYFRVCQARTQNRIVKALTEVATPYALNILRRIQDVDLVQVKANYHIRCYRSFLPKGRYKGPAPKPQLLATMEKIYRYIERSNQSVFIWRELQTVLSKDDYIPRCVTAAKYLKQKYQDKFHLICPGGYCRVLYFGELDVKKLSVERKKELARDAIDRYRNKELKKKKTKSAKKRVKESNECLSPEDCADFTWSDNEEPEVLEETKKELICSICLSSGRKLDALGEYADVYKTITAGVVTKLDLDACLLCWECKAALRNIQNFHQKIQFSQNILLNTKTNEAPNSLSNLVISPMAVLNIESTQQTECEEFNEDNIKEEIDEIYLKTDNGDDMQTLVRENDAEYLDDNFGYSEDDAKSEIGETSGTSEKPENAPEVKPRRKKKVDPDMSLIIPANTRRRAAVEAKTTRTLAKKKNLSLEVDEYFRTDKTKLKINKKKRSHSSSSESDPDWEEKEVLKVKNKELDKTEYYIHDVRDFETTSKIIREPIESHELDDWRKSEKNSGYFRTLDRDSKCEKCISFVAEEDHYQLCHSKMHPHVCHICEATFPSAKEMETHVSDHYFIFMCDFCGYKCYNNHHIQDHVETHRKVVMCLMCSGTFQTVFIFGEHFDAIHRQAICNECNKEFKNKLSLEKHILNYHMKTKYKGEIKCKLCDRTFTSYSRRKTHMFRQHGAKRDESAYCVDCDKHFASVGYYHKHLAHSIRHMSEEKRAALTLKRKVRPKKTVNVQVHRCSTCQKTFATKYNLRIHIAKIHTKEYKFYCEYCNKPFYTMFNLKEHRKFKHEGQEKKKDKICTHCGRGFTSNTILINHIRLHTGEKPFACHYPNCSSSFAQKVALKSHIKHIHEKQPRTNGSTACASKDKSNNF